ncbi:hypothetical protein Q7P37_001039 [Cladosporium fusiforme]
MSAVFDGTNGLGNATNIVSCQGPLNRPNERPRTPQSSQARDKPLPSIPSPTLSSISNILPQNASRMPDSPESLRRPPSLSYLRDYQDGGASRDQEHQQQPKKERRGLMGRKMLMLRSRATNSKKDDAQPRQEQQPSRQNFPPRQDSLREPPVEIASSPTIHDADRLAPQTTSMADKRSSIGASSFNSEDMGALPEFLSKYQGRDETEDEDTDTERPAPQPMGYSCSIEGGPDAERRAQEEEEERKSAMLSQRAEQILANAKKRLNLMEGNLRGARDLVQPLTTANLKRATSLGSSNQPTVGYGGKRFLMDGYTNTRPARTLHLQVSTPALGREYQQGHGRTHSDLALPERPHTALARGDMFGRKGRIPVRPSNSSWTDLRGSRSFESLGGSEVYDNAPQSARESPAVMGTPDPDLGPLPEESASQVAPSVREREVENDHDINRDSIYTESAFEYGLGITRSPSTTEGLREQMSSLKGRISSLRDRAKEDSIRRQSYHLRDSSPLNNAEYQAPDMWYAGATDSPMESKPHEQGGMEHSPSKNLQGGAPWGSLPLKTGSRNAFAEIAAKQQNGSLTLRERRMQHRDSHHGHRYTGSRDMPGSFNIGDNEIRSDVGVTPGAESYQHSASDAPTLSTPDNPSEYFPDFDDNESVYEDAEPDLPSSVVPHEQREDAFDYEHFFLHSAMARYQQSSSPVDSDMESVSSVSTAKGPTATPKAPGPPQEDMYPPATPETPEQLREIERKIAHSRSQSLESVSTTASFATAAERVENGRASPTPNNSSSNNTSKPNSRRSSRAATSRPPSTDPTHSRAPSTTFSATTANRRTPSEVLPNRRTSTLRRSQALTSPLLSSAPVQDPTAIAVHALLDPQGRCMGLKDKALVFGVVESLRRVCERLQEGEGDGEDAGVDEWRRRLDGCRRVLEEEE